VSDDVADAPLKSGTIGIGATIEVKFHKCNSFDFSMLVNQGAIVHHGSLRQSETDCLIKFSLAFEELTE
jgi:hypothetical protein